MSRLFHPTSRWAALALSVIVLGACADDPTAPRPAIDAPRFALGDVMVVTTNSGGKGIGSLRWAVGLATGGEIIRFAPELAGDTIFLDSTIVFTKPVTIEGPAGEGITLSGRGQRRILALHHPDTVTLRNVSLKDGRVPSGESGAAALGLSTLRFEHGTISHMTSGGAAVWYGGTIILVNATVSSNVSTGGYRALIGDKIILDNTTVAANPSGGVGPTRGTFRNSIIAGNGGRNCPEFMTVTFEGKNLSDDATCGDASVITIADAQLDSLADNGGPGLTHDLAGTSPAVDAGEYCTEAVDQRHLAREGACDLGAVESREPTAVTLAIDGGTSVNPATGWAIVSGTVQCSRAETFDVAVSLTQEQRLARTTATVSASASVRVQCDTVARPWSASMVPPASGFSIGTGTVAASTADTQPWVTPAAASSAVKMYYARQ